METKNTEKQNSWETYYYELAAHSGKKSKKLQQIIDYINQNHNSGDTLLDVGCGTASIRKHLPKDLLYTGVDISSYALSETNKDFKMELVQGVSHKLPFEDNYFNSVIALYSLEHMDKPRESLLEMRRVLKTKGHLIICAPNLELPFAYPSALRHKNFLFRIFFHLMRVYDYFSRLMGIYSFRTISDNYLNHTGKYEIQDDDLVYLASAYEVVSFLKKHGFSLTFSNKLESKKSNSLKDQVKKIITHLPGFRYYGTELFIIMQKN